MESKFKGQTENTPPSSLEGKTGESVPQSEPSAKTASTPTSTKTTVKSLKDMPPADLQKIQTAADMVKVALNILEANGLTRRFRLWNKEKTRVRAVVIVFEADKWTEELDVKE